MNPKGIQRRHLVVALGSTGALIAIGCSSSSGNEQGAGGSAGATGDAGSTAAAGEAGSAFDASATCVLAPKATDGPYYLDGSMLRKDLREGHDGAQLTLRMRVVDVANCEPIPNAVFDVWSCDAGGTYSGYTSGGAIGQVGGGGPNAMAGAGGMLGAGGMPDLPADGNIHVTPTDDTRFLRGTQVADENGVVEIITLYPGWYNIRTHHVHFKVFISETAVVTGQMYFPQELNDEIMLTDPYASHADARTKNTTDALIHSDNDPAGTWPTMTREGSVHVATVTIAVQR